MARRLCARSITMHTEMSGHMNRKLFALVASTPLALPASVIAAPAGQWFAGAQVGQSHLQGMTAASDTDTGYAASAGYLWNVDTAVQVGPEFGFAKLGTYSDGTVINGVQVSRVDARLKGAFAGVNMRLDFGQH